MTVRPYWIGLEMSDTPRTDAVINRNPNPPGRWINSEFARTLERENAQLRKEREQLDESLDELSQRVIDTYGDCPRSVRLLADSSRALLAKLEGGK
jgi:hypothetical protein